MLRIFKSSKKNNLKSYFNLLEKYNLGSNGNYKENEIQILDKKDIKDIKKINDNVGIIVKNSRYLMLNDPVKFPNGNLGTYSRIITNSALNGNIGSVVLPILPTKEFVLNIIYRHAVRSDDGGWRIEAPRGSGDINELAHKTALRELGEEQGYSAELVHLDI